MRPEIVQVVEAEVRIAEAAHDPLRAAIALKYGWTEPADIEEALALFDLVVTEYDESGAIVGLERDSYDDSWAGDTLYGLLAPHMEAGNYIVFSYLAFDGSIVQWKVLFDGQGGYRSLSGRMVYAEDEASAA